MTIRKVHIAVSQRGYDTAIEIDGEPTRDIERFTMTQFAGEDRAARLEVVRLRAEREVEELIADDIVIEGEADVVEMFADEARRAAAEQRIAVSSFVLHETGSPELITLGELLEDAKRYRALRMTFDNDPMSTHAIHIYNGVTEQIAGRAHDFDRIADELRVTYGRVARGRDAGDTPGRPKPE